MSIDVRAVTGGRELEAFIRLPWRIYGEDPCWVPPLLSTVKHALDERENPFFEHGAIRPYLAWRDGRPAGRIAAIENSLHNEFHGERTGFWGFFESEKDPEVAAALLERAAGDLTSRGFAEMRGPMSPSINSESGLLTEGHDLPPVVLTAHNPPWYPDLVEAAGQRSLKTLFAFQLREADVDVARGGAAVKRLYRLAAAVRRRLLDVTIRCLDVKRYAEETRALNDVFNEVRSPNWGFVPVTQAEFRHTSRMMKPFLDPDLVVIAERKGRIIGCLMAIPDVNQVLRRLDGRLFPLGWLKVLWLRRSIHSIRVFGAATLPPFRNIGITPLLFQELISTCARKGYRSAELSWVAEDNHNSLATIESAFAIKPYKRYKVYTRTLE